MCSGFCNRDGCGHGVCRSAKGWSDWEAGACSRADIGIGEVQTYSLYNENGNKRRIFQNFLDAKAGDLVIGYESNPVKKVVALGRIYAEQDGENRIRSSAAWI